MTIVAGSFSNNPGSFAPLPWRKPSPAHHALGPRSLRYPYPPGTTYPQSTTRQTLSMQFGTASGMDRIVGFCLSMPVGTIPTNFHMRELLTGWEFTYAYPGSVGAYIMGNVETFGQQTELEWYLSANITTSLYLSFFNFEVVPCHIS